MLIGPTLDRLNELGLTGMAHAFAEQLGVPDMRQRQDQKASPLDPITWRRPTSAIGVGDPESRWGRSTR